MSMGIDNISHVIMGPLSWIPHSLGEWALILKCFPVLKNLDIDKVMSAIELEGLMQYLSDRNNNVHLTALRLSYAGQPSNYVRKTWKRTLEHSRKVTVTWEPEHDQ